MAEQLAVPIDKNAVPYRFDIQLAGELFTFEVHYNARFDFFTVNLEKDGAAIIYGEKITYGVPMFSSFIDSRLPKWTITPKDVAGVETRAGYEEMSNTVFLFINEVTA